MSIIIDAIFIVARKFQGLIYGALLVALVVTLCSCATIEENPVTSELVVRMVTAQTIEHADDPQFMSVRIVDIGNQTLLLLQPEVQTTLDIVVALVQAEINYEALSPADRDAVDFLLIAVQQELQKRFSSGELHADEILVVRDVVQWVVDSASRYLPKA